MKYDDDHDDDHHHHCHPHPHHHHQEDHLCRAVQLVTKSAEAKDLLQPDHPFLYSILINDSEDDCHNFDELQVQGALLVHGLPGGALQCQCSMIMTIHENLPHTCTLLHNREK